MYHDQELTDLLQDIAQKGLHLLSNFKEHPTQLPLFLEKSFEISADLQSISAVLMKNPEKLWQMIIAYWKDAIGLLQDQLNHWLEGKSMPITDKRFSSEEWVNNPFFNLLSQQYLLANEHINALFENIDYGDQKLSRRLRFFTRQYLEALSPDNFIHSNPQLLAETIQSHGKNLLKGLHNFLSDIDAGSARLIMKMTDNEAFEVGRNIAITPGKVIYRNELMELIQYTPQTSKVYTTPLLIIPPWINKYYILDLSPENSLIRWLVSQGISVFVVSWVNPDVTHINKGLFEYMQEGPLTAIEIIKKQLKVRQVNTLGFCIGGTLLAILLAYLKACGHNYVKSATFLASLIDFSDPGDISVFIDENQISRLEEKMFAKGYLEGHFMANAFNSLRASDLIWSFFIKNYLRGKAPVPFDILYWNADSTNMPAKMHSQYLRWMYLHNDLIKPGKIHLNHIPIDVNKIDIPTFFVSTIKDHIAPWKTTYLGFAAMAGEKRFLLGGSGHIAGIISPPTNNKYGFYRNLAHESDAETWFANAQHISSSWWPEWLTWLQTHSGKLIPAKKLASLPYKAIMKAPGSYVLMKSGATATQTN